MKSTSNGAAGQSTVNGHVSTDQRFCGGRTCPICNGSETDSRGDGSRCFGYLSSNGKWCFCTREEHAGRAAIHPHSQAYPHLLKGKCPCGTEHAPGDPSPARSAAKRRGTIDRAYDYTDAKGKLLYQVVRFKDPKTFSQRRPNPSAKGGWAWNLTGIAPVLFKLPQLIAANPPDVVVVPEGEKDVERLIAEGFVSTCNSGGAGKWREEFGPVLRGRHIAIIPDNDDVGRDHARRVARSLAPYAASVKIVELAGLPERGDVSDWLDAGGTAEELGRLIYKAPPWDPGSDANDAIEDLRVDIRLSADFHQTVDQTAAALVAHPDIYERGAGLVQIDRKAADDLPEKKGIKRAAGAPQIVPLNAITARTIVSRLVRFWSFDRRDKEWSRRPPPKDVAEAVVALGRAASGRELVAIVEAPTLRPDGSLLSTPGYDRQTGLLYLPSATYPTIPDAPTVEDVRRSAADLLALVQDFPFREETDRAAWLALVLTLIARGAIEGPTPAFMVSANVAGSGKSNLVATASLIATGRPPAFDGYATDDDEMEKRLGAVAMVGDPLLLLDNAASGFAVGGPALDRAIMADGVFRARILGKSQMTPLVPWCTVIAITGNNLGTKDDALRRFVPCFLLSPMERPETRDPAEFAIAKESGLTLGEYVRRERPRLVAAALTILRGFVTAGRPRAPLVAMDFDKWDRLIRQAVHFAIGVDPSGSREKLEANDETTQERHRVVAAWKELCIASNRVGGMTASQAAEALNDSFSAERNKEIRNAFPRAIRPGTSLVDSNKLGYILRRHRDAVTPYGTLAQAGVHHQAVVWTVKE